MQLNRPILVGGLGLSASLWLLNIVGHSPVGHALGDGSALMGAMALGSSLWFFNQFKSARLTVAPSLALQTVDKSAIEKVTTDAEIILSNLIKELPEDIPAAKKQGILAQVEAQRSAAVQVLESTDRESLSIAIAGNKSTGKSSLVSCLSTQWQPSHKQVTSITETVGENSLFSSGAVENGAAENGTAENGTAENGTAENGTADKATAETQSQVNTDADIVLFVTAGDLTQSELQHVQSLLKAGYRTHIVFNKQDQLVPDDRQSVLQRIQTRVEDLGIGVSAIAAHPNPIKVRRHQADGTIQESTEQPEAQISSLTDRLTHLIENEAQQLVLTTTLRQAKAIKTQAQQLLNTQRRQRAMPIVEQMQWIAAGSAFASPLPSLDLLASTAINAQLIVDLGAVYGQTFSLEQGKKAASTLAELLMKLGLVELSTQAFGSLLKTHAATYVAGGALQGVSAAYLTRTVGLSLIEFFEEQSYLQAEKRKFAFSDMGERLQSIFKATKQGLGLQTFVQQALSHLPTAHLSGSHLPTAEKTAAA